MADYFEVFGLPRRFDLDRSALTRKFYELSREFHPDRFATAGPAERTAALERMSLVNEAYGTLKDPFELRQYFLRLEGFEPPKAAKAAIPSELAESWFELQDTLMENPEAAPARVRAFEQQLEGLRARQNERLLAVEGSIDAELGDGRRPSRERLDQLSAGIRELSYLASLERDVDRIKKRF